MPQASKDDSKTVGLLLDHGAKQHFMDHYGSTAYSLAASQGCVSVLTIMLQHEPSLVHAKDGHGKNLFQLAVQGFNKDKVAATTRLLWEEGELELASMNLEALLINALGKPFLLDLSQDPRSSLASQIRVIKLVLALGGSCRLAVSSMFWRTSDKFLEGPDSGTIEYDIRQDAAWARLSRNWKYEIIKELQQKRKTREGDETKKENAKKRDNVDEGVRSSLEVLRGAVDAALERNALAHKMIGDKLATLCPTQLIGPLIPIIQSYLGLAAGRHLCPAVADILFNAS